MIKFNFVNETASKIPEKFFQEIVNRFYKILKNRIDKMLLKRDGCIDLVLVEDKTIQAMNAEYRDLNKPTDVLSFAYLEVTEFEEGPTDIIAGDIFISIDTAKKQAKEHKHALNKELEILFIHGLLHLFGFDHKTDKEEKEMASWAKKILR